MYRCLNLVKVDPIPGRSNPAADRLHPSLIRLNSLSVKVNPIQDRLNSIHLKLDYVRVFKTEFYSSEGETLIFTLRMP